MSPSEATWSTYLRAALRHRWLILIPGAALFALAVLATVVRPDVYESRAILMPQRAQASRGVIREAVVATTNDIVKAAQERLLGAQLLSSCVKQLDLYPEITEERGMMAAVQQLRDQVTVEWGGRSQAITVVVQWSEGKDPANTAMEIANRLSTLFVGDQRQLIKGKAMQLRQFLEREEQAALEELLRAEQQLSRFRKDHAGELPEDRGANKALIAQAEARIASSRDRLERNRDESERLIMEAFQLEQLIATPVPNASASDWLAQSLRQHIASLEAQLASDLTRFTEESDRIQLLRAQISEAKTRLDDLVERNVQETGQDPKDRFRWMLDTYKRKQEDIVKDDAALAKAVATALADIEEYNRRIAVATELEAEYTLLKRRVDEAQGKRNNLLNRRQETDITVEFQNQTEDNTVPVIVEQPAFSAKKPVGPRHLMVSGVGLLFGLGLGVLLAIVRTRLDRSYHSSDDLRYLMPGSVIITLPEVTGPGSRAGQALTTGVLSLLVTAVFTASITVLGIRLGWWGQVEMLDPLIQLKANILG